MRHMILRPPGAPTARKGRPALSASTGTMLFSPRLNPAIEFVAPGIGLKTIMLLGRSTPVPGTTTPDPKPPTAVCVPDTMLRSPSMTLRCVVQSPSLGGDALAAPSGRGCGS